MEKAYDGRQIVGMDLHRRRSVLVRMTQDGRRLSTSKITNSPQELRREIARAGKSPQVVLEATYGWYWAADTLAAAGAEVHLAHLPELADLTRGDPRLRQAAHPQQSQPDPRRHARRS